MFEKRRGVPMEENPKKKEIIIAAGRCFLRYGYGKTTMVDIGKGAGLNKASLYYYYKDKNSIFKEVVLNEFSQYLLMVQDKLTKLDSFYDKILLTVNESINYNNLTCNSYQLTAEILNGLKEDTKDGFEYIKQENISMLRSLIEKGKATGEFLDCDENLIAESITKVSEAILNTECPLFMDVNERDKTYNKIAVEISQIVGLMLKGILKK